MQKEQAQATCCLGLFYAEIEGLDAPKNGFYSLNAGRLLWFALARKAFALAGLRSFAGHDTCAKDQQRTKNRCSAYTQ